MTVPAIPRNHIFDYTSDKLNELADIESKNKSFWKRLFNTAINKSVLICYDAADKMLTIESGDSSCKYMSLSRPNALFICQAGVRNGRSPGNAIRDLATLLSESKKKYEGCNSFIKLGADTSAQLNVLCDDFIVENILPRDSFWHNWIFGWLFAVPFAFSGILFNFTCSLLGIMLLFVLLFALLTYGHYAISIKLKVTKKVRYIWAVIALKATKAFLWLTLVSFCIYMFPKMETIAVMENYDYSSVTIHNMNTLYSDGTAISGWFMCALFLIAVLLKFGIHKDYTLLAFYPPHIQQKLYNENRTEIEIELAGQPEVSHVISDLKKTTVPYAVLAAAYLGRDLSKSILPAIAMMLIVNDCFLMYATAFLMASVAGKIVSVTLSVRESRRLGLI